MVLLVSGAPLMRHNGLQGLSMFTVSNDLVVYGGDKSGLAVCTMAGADWKWAAPSITGRDKPLPLFSICINGCPKSA